MAVTATRVGQGPARNLPYITVDNAKRTVTDVTLDSSFQSGGEPLTAANLGLNTVYWAQAEPTLSATTTVNVAFAGYDPGNALLHVYDETPAEISGDASGSVIRVTAYGS